MNVQNYDHPSMKKLYSGCSGVGKTTLCWADFKHAPARVKFIFDHKAGEMAKRYKLRPIFTSEELVEKTCQGGYVCFDPMLLFPGDREGGFEFFCEFIFAVSEKIKGRKLFLADELQTLVGTNSKPKPLLVLCDVGRTYQIDCWFCTSAPNAIHNLVRNQITECFAFRHGDAATADWLCGKSYKMDELLNLKKGEYLWRNFDTGEASAGGKAF